MTAEPGQLYAEREKRISDAIALRKPDRVPVWNGVPGPYPSERLGISREEQMMDAERSLEAGYQTALYYEPDMVEVMPALGAVLARRGVRSLLQGPGAGEVPAAHRVPVGRDREEDVAVAAVRFRSGALGSVEGTTGTWPGTKIRVEIGGTKGSVVLEDEAI